jgi:hypothetical protein
MTERVEPLLDDACAEFVRWLTTKTLEGRARWEKHPNGLITHLPCSTLVQFITQSSEQGQSWRLFRVRDSSGELFRANRSRLREDTPPLTTAVEALFLTLVWSGSHLVH